MAKVLVARDYDSFTGITEEFWHDPEAKTVTIRRLMDIDPVVNQIKQIRESNPTNFRKDDGAYKSAMIHPIAIENWKREKGFDWFKSTSNEKKQWLNRSENAHWKLRKGKI
jgi:hypothetical protein